jgi:hypothetical protein
MAALFAEDPAARFSRGGSWDIDVPLIPAGPDGTADLAIDMILKTGLIVLPGPATPRSRTYCSTPPGFPPSWAGTGP